MVWDVGLLKTQSHTGDHGSIKNPSTYPPYYVVILDADPCHVKYFKYAAFTSSFFFIVFLLYEQTISQEILRRQ